MKTRKTDGIIEHARTSRKTGISSRTATSLSALMLVSAGFFALVADAQSYSFSRVDVRGNERVDTSTIVSYAGIGAGQTVSAGQLNDAYQNIAGSGLFEKVELVPRGNTLQINVQEYPTINQIAFEGNRRLNDEAMMELIGSRSRRVFSPSVAEADAAKLTDAYRQSGRLAATVTPKVIRRSDNRVDLVFEVTEGRVSEVERLSFVGNRSYSERRLRRVLATKQAGALRLLFQNDTLVEDRLELDKQLLTDFYHSRGFIDFRILSVASELDRNRRGWQVTFNVQEGQRYRFGNISVSSTIAGLDTSDFRKAVKLRSGAVYSPVPIDVDIARLERLAVKKSLNFIRVEPRITRDNRNQRINVEYVVTEGPHLFVERIDIEGNTTTLDRVIRRQFRTVEGDPFNPREISAAADRIRALGFFADTQVEPREGAGASQVVVDVNVEETPTGAIGFGASYGTNTGVGLNLSFSERNFLGRGQQLRFEAGATDSTTTFVFDFYEPSFLGRDVGFGINTFYRTTDHDNAYYNSDRGLFEPSFSFPLGDYTRLALRANASYGKVFDVDEDSSYIVRKDEDEEGLFAGAVGYTFSYNTLSGGLDPTAGIQLQFRQDFGYRSDDASYIQTEALARARKAIWNEEITLRAELEAGAIAFYGGDSRIIERYQLSNKIRGFEPNGAGVRDRNVENEDVLGGNYFAVARFEADFPLGLPEEYGILGGVFWDVGSVWSLDNTSGGPDGNNPVDDDFYLRSSVGVSLFWETPLGPLRFNFSQPVAMKSYDEPQNFEFTVSTRF
ncbi:outer membrane protein assembly factor BamA [Tropicimonas sp.]|uniref:outer membrane protein assembly factor BamA n=1 Tax=Tropicimonas sp. TaxID=2067044 RepID=UPI003A84B742